MPKPVCTNRLTALQRDAVPQSGRCAYHPCADQTRHRPSTQQTTSTRHRPGYRSAGFGIQFADRALSPVARAIRLAAPFHGASVGSGTQQHRRSNAGAAITRRPLVRRALVPPLPHYPLPSACSIGVCMPACTDSSADRTSCVRPSLAILLPAKTLCSIALDVVRVHATEETVLTRAIAIAWRDGHRNRHGT
jgi:hypothetical protein